MGNTGFNEKLRAVAARGKTRITAAYILLGALWILLSDKALYMLMPMPEAAMRVAIYKGWAYVAISAALFISCSGPSAGAWSAPRPRCAN